MRGIAVAAGWAIAATIVWLSVTPAPPQIDVDQGDKLGHFAAYATLMFWFCLLYRRRTTRIGYALLWIGMGVALEFVQRSLGYRSFEINDMLADGVGVLIGWAAALIVPTRLPGAGTGKR